MGRKPYKHANLPKGMRARIRGKNTYYYLDTGARPRKEIPLGSDYVLAVQKWSELTYRPAQEGNITFSYVVARYWETVIPTKAPDTQRSNTKEKAWLLKFFDDPPAPLDQIKPVHIRQYMDWRKHQAYKEAVKANERLVTKGKPAKEIPANIGHVRANREKSLFSHIWNFAREHGYTSMQNPCEGIKRFKEKGRVDVLVSDELFYRVLNTAEKPIQFALRLAYLTGQRPADVLKMRLTDDNFLHVKQGKTAAKLRIEIAGELLNLISEIKEYKATANSLTDSILVNEKGQPLTRSTFRRGFDLARELAGVDKDAFQFRDLRAKAATDLDSEEDIRRAQALLGHTTQDMTVDYLRERSGKRVKPVK